MPMEKGIDHWRSPWDGAVSHAVTCYAMQDIRPRSAHFCHKGGQPLYAHLLPALLHLAHVLQGYPEGRLLPHAELQRLPLYGHVPPVVPVDAQLLFLQARRTPAAFLTALLGPESTGGCPLPLQKLVGHQELRAPLRPSRALQ